MSLKLQYITLVRIMKSQYRKLKYGYDYRNYKLAWVDNCGIHYREEMLIEDSTHINLKPTKKEFLQKININLTDQTRILDVGAGFGRMLKWFEDYKNVYAEGLDISQELIAKNIASAPIYEFDITRNLLDQGFVPSMPFDTIYSRGIFMYFSNKQAKNAFENILSMLNPSGKYYCYEWKEENRRLRLLEVDKRIIFCDLPMKNER